MKHLILRESAGLSVDVLDDGRRMLKRALIYRIDGVQYVVPSGFITDYSSLPALYRPFVRFDRVDYAGVVHDCAYKTCFHSNMTRSQADTLWRVVAMHGPNGANRVQAWSGYFGLRAGGWVTWNKYRKADK